MFVMASDEFPQRVKARRQAKRFSLETMARRASAELPASLELSKDKVDRLERGRTAEEKADPLLIAALAAAGGTNVRELSELVDRDLRERVVPLLRKVGVLSERDDTQVVTHRYSPVKGDQRLRIVGATDDERLAA